MFPEDPCAHQKEGFLVKIIADTWRSSLVGIVLVEHRGRTQVYIGIGDGIDQRADAQKVADWGSRLSFQEAKGFFPALSEAEYGTED